VALVVLAVAIPEVAGAQQRDTLVLSDSARKLLADSLRRLAVVDSLIRRTPVGSDSLRALADTLRRRLEGRDIIGRKVDVVWEPVDSAMTSLLGREGYAVTKYQGKNVVFNADNHTMYLIGKRAAVQRDSATLIGDTITFNDSTQLIEARGDTVVLRDPAQGPDDVVSIGRIRYDIVRRMGRVENVTTAVESGQRWIVHGRVAAFRGDTSAANRSAFYAKDGWLTSCEEDEPHYHFAAKEMKLISKNIMVVRPAVLYIADIPVMWLPFVFNDMRPGRRSGLIPPRIGFNQVFRSSPFLRRTVEDIGYYFALNDYTSLTVTTDWRSDARGTENDPGYVKFNGVLDYRWRDRFISGSLGVSAELPARRAARAGRTHLRTTRNSPSEPE
jgi:lipopolysaccharide assembly outer membrane protein LptD (OstA)